MKLTVAFGISLAAAAFALPQPSPLQKRAPQVHKRIIGGDEAAEHEFPFAVSIILKTPNGSETHCGGIILSKQYVFTAADCLYDNDGDEIDARSALSVGYGSSSIGFQETVKVVNTKQHENFGITTGENNVAVLKVENMDLEGTGATIAKFYKGGITPGTAGTAIGWGITENSDSDSTSHELKKATVYVGHDEDCHDYDGQYMHGIFSSNSKATFCIDNSISDGDGPCFSDNGSPLVISVGGKQQVAGIYSYGGGPDGDEECATSGGFEFYENVNKRLPFIRRATGLDF